MEKPAPILMHKFNSSSTNLSNLEKDEAQILHLYVWESYLHDIKATKKKWKQDKEALYSIKILTNLENLWINFRKQMYKLRGEEYELMSLIQYRMMKFIQNRQNLRKITRTDKIKKDITNTEEVNLNSLDKNGVKQISLSKYLKS